MKTNCFLLGLILLYADARAEASYKISEAIQKKLVNVSMRGAKADTSFHGDYSSHYGPCMAMEITSAAGESLNLNLEYGYKLVPDDSSLQTMIVTQTLIVKLQPKQKKNCRIYAMCTEAHDGGPSSENAFVLRNRATGSLLELAGLLNRKKYQGDAAQNAVWCLTNDYQLHSIFSPDTAMMYDLRRFVAKAKGIGLDKIYAGASENSSTEPVRTFTRRTVYSGSLSYSFSRTSKVMIALFDEDNHMKKVYVNNETQRDGEYTYNYQIGSDEMANKKHYLRMFRDGRLEQEISIIPPPAP
jgi:hypothetical protein